MNIGIFKPTEQGYDGSIIALGINHKAKFFANTKKKSDDSPDFFIKTGTCDLGVAWKAIAKSDEGRRDNTEPYEYIKVKLDSPALPKSIWAALFINGKSADLVWSRNQPKEQ